MYMERSAIMKLGQGNYQVTKIEMNEWGLLDIELTCQAQSIYLELNAKEAQQFVNDIYSCVDAYNAR